MARMYKCWYNNCPHNQQVDEEEAIKADKRRYHKECYKDFQNLKKIRELYYDHIDKTVVFSQLNKVIDNIINKKGIGTDYLLYSIEYAIENDIEVRYPASLFYLINNFKIRKSYSNAEVSNNLKIYS